MRSEYIVVVFKGNQCFVLDSENLSDEQYEDIEFRSEERIGYSINPGDRVSVQGFINDPESLLPENIPPKNFSVTYSYTPEIVDKILTDYSDKFVKINQEEAQTILDSPLKSKPPKFWMGSKGN